jgi:hypothetical protein
MYVHLLLALIEEEAQASTRQTRSAAALAELVRLVKLAWTDRVWRAPLPPSMPLSTVEEIWLGRVMCLCTLGPLLGHPRETLRLFELKKGDIEHELAKGDRQRILAMSLYLNAWLRAALLEFEEEHQNARGKLCAHCGESEACYEKLLWLWDKYITSLVLTEGCHAPSSANKVGFNHASVRLQTVRPATSLYV